jgi:hypothetical protein
MSALVDLLPRTVDGLIFSAPLVPPTLDGRKTNTRRMAKKWLRLKVGDLLFVRETFFVNDMSCVRGPLPKTRPAPNDPTDPEGKHLVLYRADGEFSDHFEQVDGDAPWRPSIHMPKWASRCVLRITEPPRLERVQCITEEDAKREGVLGQTSTGGPFPNVAAFVCTWKSLHTKPGERWADNPQIVRLAFERAA